MPQAIDDLPKTAQKGRAPSGFWNPTVIAALVILALVAVFAVVGSRSLVRPAGAGYTTVTGQPVEGSAKLMGAMQQIVVDPSTGIFNPNVIVAKPGMPLVIVFKPGTGCLATVRFETFQISQDISNGGTVILPAMKAGEYPFECGMKMVFGKIVVR